MTSTDLAAVRAAADTVLGRFGCNRADCRDCAKYVFATIPADATLAIDTEWLREVWGFEDDPDNEEQIDQYIMLKIPDAGRLYWNVEDMEFLDNCHCVIKTRIQAMMLFIALGIQPQPPKVKE